MSNQLEFHIDSIMKNGQTGTISVIGWALNLEDKKVPNILLKPQNEQISVSFSYRSDVNALHHLKADTLAGFQISIPAKVIANFSSLTIICSEKESSHEEEINLRVHYPIQPGTEKNWCRQLRKLKKGLGYLKRNGLKSTIKKIQMEKKDTRDVDYQKWIEQNEKFDLSEIKAEISGFSYQPLISILMPVYNVEKKWLEKCIQSVQNQYYPNWELCIADDASTNKEVKEVLESFKASDGRIKVVYRKENGHICYATNSALDVATGEFSALLDNDDELAPNAFYEVVKLLNTNPNLDLIYSDENKIDVHGVRKDPTFKPDWSPDLLLSTNYICHLGVYRTSILKEIKGFRPGYEGAQDYDLVLRFTEQTSAAKIGHIPKVLYHWRMLETSTAVNQDSKGYAFEAGRLAVEDALLRRGIKGSVTHASGNGLYDVHYDIIHPELVSVIIPTKNGYDDVKRCVDSIIEKTTYNYYEIILADNGSDDERMKKLYEGYQKILGEKFKPVSIDIPFNYAKINNLAAKHASGSYYLFLNNDTEVISADWMEKMVSFAQFDRFGAVGAKLYYPNYTIQHAGVILGLGGAAGHGHHTFPKGDFGYFGRLEVNCNYLAVTAACMMMKANHYKALGGFDESFTVAFNDVDLCIRCHELGCDNVWLHGVELFHYESQSRGYEDTPEKIARFKKETDSMKKKWPKYIENDPYYNPNLTRKAGDFSINLD